MKLISIIGSRLREYYSRNRVIFILYVVGYLLCTLFFIYMYNNAMPHLVKDKKNSAEDRYYNFYLAGGDTVTEDFINQLLSTYGIENIEMSHYLSAGECGDADWEGRLVVARYGTEPLGTVSKGRTYFTDEEMGTGNAIVVPIGIDLDSVFLFDREFEVIATGDYCFFVPPAAFYNYDISVDSFEVLFSNILTTEEENEFIGVICSALTVEGMVGEAYRSDTAQTEGANLMIVWVMAGVMLLVFSYLVKYMMELGIHENVIYRMVGADRGDLLRIIFYENLVMNLVLVAAAFLIYELAYEPVFNNLNFYRDVKVSGGDMLVILFSMIFLSMLIILPTVIRISRMEVIEAKRKVFF